MLTVLIIIYFMTRKRTRERENAGLYFLRNAEISNAIALHFVQQYRTEERYRNLARVRSQGGGTSILERKSPNQTFDNHWMFNVHPVVQYSTVDRNLARARQTKTLICCTHYTL